MRPPATRITAGSGSRRAARGAVIVELALLLPLVLALALAVFTGGTAYFRKVTVVDAAREGARYGATLALDATGSTASWTASVKQRVVDASGGDLALTDVCAQLVYPTGGNDCGVADPAGAASEPSVHLVKVSATRTATVEVLFFTSSPTLTGKVAARYERDTG